MCLLVFPSNGGTAPPTPPIIYSILYLQKSQVQRLDKSRHNGQCNPLRDSYLNTAKFAKMNWTYSTSETSHKLRKLEILTLLECHQHSLLQVFTTGRLEHISQPLMKCYLIKGRKCNLYTRCAAQKWDAFSYSASVIYRTSQYARQILTKRAEN